MSTLRSLTLGQERALATVRARVVLHNQAVQRQERRLRIVTLAGSAVSVAGAIAFSTFGATFALSYVVLGSAAAGLRALYLTLDAAPFTLHPYVLPRVTLPVPQVEEAAALAAPLADTSSPDALGAALLSKSVNVALRAFE